MIGKDNIDFIVDTGATVNLMEESDYLWFKDVTLQNSSTEIFLYDSEVPLKILGKFETVIETCEKITCAEFVVKKNTTAGGSSMCYKTAHEVGVVTVVNKVHDADSAVPPPFVNKYKNIFSGIGKIKNYQVKLHIDISPNPIEEYHFMYVNKLNQSLRK